MQFVSRFLSHEPFSTLKYRRLVPSAEALLQKAENRLQKRLINTDKLMYNINAETVLDAETGKLFSGKFLIPSDKFERIVHVKNGKEVASLVREKNGTNYFLEKGQSGKFFKTKRSSEELNSQIQKQLAADQNIYNKMIDTFEKSH